MKIKFLHSISSAEGWAHPPGRPVDFHDDELAQKFIDSGIAVAVEPDPDPEPETQPENTGRKKKR